MTGEPFWEVLIATIPHRHERLCSLLASFGRQWQPGFGVRVLRDNLQRSGWAAYGKYQDLTEASRAEYTCFVDDDDEVAPDYVARIMEALETRPDYVGFKVYFTEDGRRNWYADHSLPHGGWYSSGNWLLRDISNLNPIRRELALLADWHEVTDVEWASVLRASGQVRTQAYIDAEMYRYYRCSTDGFITPREPMPEPLPELPSYPWLTVMDTPGNG